MTNVYVCLCELKGIIHKCQIFHNSSLLMYNSLISREKFEPESGFELGPPDF